MLRVRNLRKYYGEFLAVDDVSLDVQPGHVVGFRTRRIYPSGFATDPQRQHRIRPELS